MSTRSSGIKQAAASLPKPVIEPEPEPEQHSDENGRKEVRQTLYLPFGVHEQLREVSFSKRVSMQEIYRRALNLWFRQEGLPSWEEAKRRGKQP